MRPNLHVAGYYAIGALVVLRLSAAGWPWTSPLVWPGAALLLVAGGYLGLGPSIYRKRNGRLRLGTRLLFAPALFGQHASLWYYRRTCRPWDEALPGLLLGCKPTESEAAALIRKGVTAVLDLTAEFTEPAALRNLRYLNLPLLDLTAPTQAQLQTAVAFIRSGRNAGGTVYVHCKVGYSRTATAAAAYLLDSRACSSLDEALALLRSARPGIVVRPEAIRCLESFAGKTACRFSGANPAG